MDFSKDPNVCAKHKNLIKSAQTEKAHANSLCALIKNFKYCKNDADQAENDADPIKIPAIKEDLRLKLTSIASKLLGSEHFNFYNLSEEEQQLWSTFDKSEVYEFITGEKDMLPEFQYNWIEPCQLTAHLSPELQRFFQDLQPPLDQNKTAAAPPPAPPVPQQPIPAAQPAPAPPTAALLRCQTHFQDRAAYK
jgi:hypothetical protein